MRPRATPAAIPAAVAGEMRGLWAEIGGRGVVEAVVAAAPAVSEVDVEDDEVAVVVDAFEGTGMGEDCTVGERLGIGDDDATDGVLIKRIEVVVVEVLGGIVGSVEEEVVEVTGACPSDAMLARASGAGAAHVSFVVVEQSTPVTGSLLQQAHSPLVALYTISGSARVAA